MISTAILRPSADPRWVVSYKRKDVHEVLVYRLVKLAQEIVLLGELQKSKCSIFNKIFKYIIFQRR